MINAIFIYNGKKVLIQCNLEDKMRNICEKFAVKADIKVDSKIYLYNNKPLSINRELNKTFAQQIDSNDTGDKEITVLDNPDEEYTIKLHYEGTIKEVKLKQDEKYGSLFTQIGNFFSLKAKSYYTLCNGVLIGGEDELDKSISQLSNSMNKETNEINLLIEANESFLSEDSFALHSDNKDMKSTPKGDEIKAQEIKINERKRVAKFLYKLYVKLLVEYSLIGIFLCLGFYKKYNKIFIRNDLSLYLTLSSGTLYIIYIGILLLKYKKNKCHCCIYFHILIFIPFLTIMLFLLSSFLENYDFILSFIVLFVIDIISVILFLLIFKRNIGYGILLLSLVLNAIYICPFLYIKHITAFFHFNTAFSLASVLIFYILFFNTISKKKLDEDEGIAAVYFFNYSFFFVFSIPICISFISIIIIPIGLLLFILVFLIIFLFGAGLILLFIFIKIFFSLYCKSKKNKINKYLKEFE